VDDCGRSHAEEQSAVGIECGSGGVFEQPCGEKSRKEQQTYVNADAESVKRFSSCRPEVVEAENAEIKPGRVEPHQVHSRVRRPRRIQQVMRIERIDERRKDAVGHGGSEAQAFSKGPRFGCGVWFHSAAIVSHFGAKGMTINGRRLAR